MKQLKLTLLLIVTIGLVACQAKLEYGDSNSVAIINKQLNTSEMETATNQMISSMLTAPIIMTLTDINKPTVFIDQIKNNTSEHIDTKLVTHSIKNQLLTSSKFRFIDITKIDAARNQLNYQFNTAIIDPSTAINLGREIGAQYMLYGNLSAINHNLSNTRGIIYKVTLRLMDLNTGLIEWSAEKQIKSNFYTYHSYNS